MENPQTNSTSTETKLSSQNAVASNRRVGRVEATPLANRAEGWQEKQLNLVGLHMCLNETARLSTVVWPADLSKWDFVKQG